MCVKVDTLRIRVPLPVVPVVVFATVAASRSGFVVGAFVLFSCGALSLSLSLSLSHTPYPAIICFVASPPAF